MSLILVDLTPASGAHGVRGIGRYVRGLGEALAAMEDPVIARVHSIGGEGTPIASAGRGLPVDRWRPQDIGWLTGWLSDSGLALRSGATAFHATDPRKALPPLRARLMPTVYDLIPLLDPAVTVAARAHRRVVYHVYLAVVRRAERVIAISRTTALDVTEYLRVPEDRVDVVYPVVQAPAPTTLRAPAAEPTFLSIGVPDPHKQPELAIEALATFRAATGAGRLRFIGPAAAVHVQPLQALARRRGVEPWIEFAGAVTDRELEAALAEAHAVLALSRREGFGLPAVEAVLRGTPVIAVDTPVARETLGEAATFVPSQAEAIAAAMERPAPPAPPTRAALAERYRPAAVAASLAAAYRAVLDR